MENEVYKLLDKLNIKYTKIEHPPLFTCEDNKKYNIKFEALVCKNLFIRNSNKSRCYLVTMPLEKSLDLKALKMLLEETRLSFANEEALEQKLGVKSGAVSIFNVINMKDNGVSFILDKDILKYEKVAFHPNVNTATITINSEELYKILECYNAKYKFVTLNN